MKENRIEIRTGNTRSWVYQKGTRCYFTQGVGFTFRISQKDYEQYLRMAVSQ